MVPDTRPTLPEDPATDRTLRTLEEESLARVRLFRLLRDFRQRSRADLAHLFLRTVPGTAAHDATRKLAMSFFETTTMDAADP